MTTQNPTNYFEAVKNILDGTYVKNLEKLRLKHNDSIIKKYSLSSAKRKMYTPESTLVSFFADAENEILLGKNPNEIYSISKTPEEFRESGRQILENWVDYKTGKLNKK